MKINPLQLKIIQASSDDLKDINIDCGIESLNGFLINEGPISIKANLSTIFLLSYRDEIIGYFTLSADSIKIGKRLEIKYPYYPSAKIGRFAIDKKYQGLQLGSLILEWIKGYLKNMRKDLAMRLISVDAHPNAQKFYEKNNFKIVEIENKSFTTLMYYDLDKNN